jgi:type I restriction-modification system DNA methylase subunit
MAEQNLSAFLWSIADLLRGDYKQRVGAPNAIRPGNHPVEPVGG